MEQIAPILDKLAQQLGTTASMLWKVLIAQAAVEAQLAFIMIWVSVVSLFIIMPLTTYLAHWADKEDHNGILFVSFTAALLSGIGGLIGVISNSYTWWICTHNPEYWALHEVLKMFSK